MLLTKRSTDLRIHWLENHDGPIIPSPASADTDNYLHMNDPFEFSWHVQTFKGWTCLTVRLRRDSTGPLPVCLPSLQTSMHHQGLLFLFRYITVSEYMLKNSTWQTDIYTSHQRIEGHDHIDSMLASFTVLTTKQKKIGTWWNPIATSGSWTQVLACDPMCCQLHYHHHTMVVGVGNPRQTKFYLFRICSSAQPPKLWLKIFLPVFELHGHFET
jgi:hypothetical protein